MRKDDAVQTKSGHGHMTSRGCSGVVCLPPGCWQTFLWVLWVAMSGLCELAPACVIELGSGEVQLFITAHDIP